MAENENENITTPEEPTETTPTLEELAAQVATLSQNLTAMQDLLLEVIGEAEYELRYSGEQVENLLDSGRTVFNNKTAAQIVGIMTRLYPLYIRWGSFTVNNLKVNPDNGWYWGTGTLTDIIPSGVKNPAVFMVCDWDKTHFDSQSMSYKVKNGTSIDWRWHIYHTPEQAGTYNFKIYYLILGKNSGGGSIVG